MRESKESTKTKHEWMENRKIMEYISFSDLILIGRGANGAVYKYTKPLIPYGLSAVVKISGMRSPKYALQNYDRVKHAGLMHLAFMEECCVDGKPALLMEDLFTDEMVYVSPNSVRNGYMDNQPEAYLLQNKLYDIPNMESVLMQMRDIAQCTNGNGIGLDMDMISFGVQRGNKNSEVSYKLVDIDVMLQDDYSRGKLYENNVAEAKYAITLFVKYFVAADDVKQKLFQQIKDFPW